MISQEKRHMGQVQEGPIRGSSCPLPVDLGTVLTIVAAMSDSYMEYYPLRKLTSALMCRVFSGAHSCRHG